MKVARWPLAPVLLALLLLPAPPMGVTPPFARAQAGTPPLAAGVHAPDRGWEEPDFDLMADGRFGGVKMMSYHTPADYTRLRRDNPGLAFTVRLDSPWNELPPPAEFAAYHAPRLRALVLAGFFPAVEIGNEPNLELHPGAEVVFAVWYRETLRALRAAVPELSYGFPGLAVDQREMDWLAANATAIAESDWLGVHAYWKDEQEMLDPGRALRLVEYHRRFPRLPLRVTEAGNNAPGVPLAERARQYGRFVRTVARLPYVRAVHFFILSGTASWRLFFFDDLALAAVREAPREPAPVGAGLDVIRRDVAATLAPLVGWPGGSGRGGAGVAPAADVPWPLPAQIVPTARRRLIVDPAPRAISGEVPAVPHSLDGRWVPFEGGLRSASAYLATDLSLRLETAAPLAGVPFSLGIAEVGGSGQMSGFTLLWDGTGWRLQYRRAGAVLEDYPLAGVPPAGRAGATPGPAAPPAAGAPPPLDERLQVELALELRSAAAWIWRPGDPQPAQPQAVFAPPPVAVDDATRPRYVLLPTEPVSQVVLEGLTRFT